VFLQLLCLAGMMMMMMVVVVGWLVGFMAN
jgi:hypothetical protein